MLFFVTRYIIPFEGNDSHSEEKFEEDNPANPIHAKKRWHSIIASDIDKQTIAYELIQIIREDGICIASEILDNRLPETEPETEEVTENE